MPEEIHSHLPDWVEENQSNVDPTAYFSSIAEHSSIPSDSPTLAALSRWSEDDWERWIRESDCEDLLPALECIFKISWHDTDYNQMKSRLGRVVSRIANENPINELRSRRYLSGVERFLNIPQTDASSAQFSEE
jgi:hypothetical protein